MKLSEIQKRTWQGIVVLAAVAVWACSDPSDEDGGADEETGGPGATAKRDVLISVADNVLAPSHEEFATAAAALQNATQAHLDAIDDGGDTAASIAAAQQAWRDAWTAWQVVEMLQVGPSGASGVAAGGMDLGDEVYSWPSTNACRVDQEVVAGEFDESDFVEKRLANVYGLDALEYLLFWTDASNTCAPQLPINQAGEWDALGEEEVTRRRAAYAVVIAGAVRSTADALAAHWAEDGDFHGWLSDPGSGDPYPDVDTAMDELMRAMFYTDQVLKDAKLGVPAGLKDCGSATCVDELESEWASVSKEAVVANLEGFRRLYYGGTDPEAATGFDDLLIGLDREDLADEMTAAIDEAAGAAGSVDGSFREALIADEAALDPVHAGVKRITDLLKGEFSMVLSLKLPTEGGGDAD